MAHRTINELTEALDLAIVELTAARQEAAEATRASDVYEVIAHVNNGLHDVIEAEARAVSVWRSWGASWTDVGSFYGTTRQAAQQRFGGVASA